MDSVIRFPYPLSTHSNPLNPPLTSFTFLPLVGTPPSNRLLLTASLGRILPSSLLSPFRPTHTLNIHPSALPAYRGPAPIQRAILNGERDAAVCIIEMKRRGGIDAGDVLGRIPIVRVPLKIFYPPRTLWPRLCDIPQKCGPCMQTIPPGIAYGPLRGDSSSRRAADSSSPFSAPC